MSRETHTPDSLRAALVAALESEHPGLSAVLDAPWVQITDSVDAHTEIAGLDIEPIGRLPASVTDQDSLLTAAWKILAQNDDLFLRPVSESKNMVAVFEEVAPNIDIRDISERYTKDPHIKNVWEIFPQDVNGERIMTPYGGSLCGMIFHYRDGSVEIDVSGFDPGTGGSSVYAAVGNWARNTEKHFRGDRNGISAAGMSRRLENLISLALKFGNTDFIYPHPEMLSTLGMDWNPGNTEYNLDQMLRASYKSLTKGIQKRDNTDQSVKAIPEISEFFFNPFSGEFYNGKTFATITDADFDALGDRGRAQKALAGRATLKRAAITNTLLREEDRAHDAGAKGALLARLVRLASGDLSRARHIQYSKGLDDTVMAFVQLETGHVCFVADQIPKNWTRQQLVGLATHEIAIHALRLHRSSTGFRAILSDLRHLKDRGDPAVLRAYACVPKGTPGDLVDEEGLGYLMEIAPNRIVARRFIQWLKNTIRSLCADFPELQRTAFSVWASRLTADDLRSMGRHALCAAAQSVPFSPVAITHGTDAPEFSELVRYRDKFPEATHVGLVQKCSGELPLDVVGAQQDSVQAPANLALGRVKPAAVEQWADSEICTVNPC